MEGETRREAILAHLEAENKPVSGSRLSQLFGVSRQVIVQDIALIRATNKNILSTNKGYVLYKPEQKCPAGISDNYEAEDGAGGICKYGRWKLQFSQQHIG